MRFKKNRLGLRGRAARQIIEREDLDQADKKWARKKDTLAKYTEEMTRG